MNLSNLIVGQIVPNYITMCELLGEKPRTSNSKKAQIKEWECHFKFARDGHKYIIIEIYPHRKTKEDLRTENGLYVKLIEHQLLCEFAISNQIHQHATKTELFRQLGIINEHKLSEYEINQTLKKHAIEKWHYDHFYGRRYNKFSNVLYKSLNSLESRKLLYYNNRILITDLNSREEKKWVASIQETNKILDLEKHILFELGHHRVPYQLYDRCRYYETVEKKMCEIFGWSTYKDIELIYNPPQCLTDIPVVKREIVDLSKSSKTELNQRVLDYMDRQATNKFEANRKKHEDLLNEKKYFGSEPPSTKVGLYPDNYLEIQKLLHELFIKIWNV